MLKYMYTPTAVAATPSSVRPRKVVRTSGLRGVGSDNEAKDVEASVLACRTACKEAAFGRLLGKRLLLGVRHDARN